MPIPEILATVLDDVVSTVINVWPYLAISIVGAAALTTYSSPDRLVDFMRRRAVVAVGAAVGLAAFTPFCSCGTTAVVLGGLATATPWAPLIAFMVASPLTSPSELFLSAGLFGWKFALLFFMGTIVIGIGAGAVGHLLDRRGSFKGQARLAEQNACLTGECAVAPAGSGIGPGTAAVTEYRTRPTTREFAAELWATTRRLSVLFLGFTALGYLAIRSIPTDWIGAYLGGDSFAAVPLAALLGIPAYLNTEASLPLVASLMDGGMGPGPAMAFLVTGAGTSVGAISGLFVIARGRVVALVVSLLFGGALVLGWVTHVLF
ncbi:MAG: permease [Acidimicrobiia bacterium]|jgi:uncharacterized membrane protein YraQ (UPF0718 family)|nr:MAG: permease [Acidimicrobiia bacterium]